MKHNKQRCWVVALAIALMATGVTFPAQAMAGQVIVPYAATGGGWWTGLAITNVEATEATEPITVAFFAQNGTHLGETNIGALAAKAFYVNVVENIFEGVLPDRFWLVISHGGNAQIEVTAFFGNTSMGGFSTMSGKSDTSGRINVIGNSTEPMIRGENSLGPAIEGVATDTGKVENYGGYFEAAGIRGVAVKGVATSTEYSPYAGDYSCGGVFESKSRRGIGVVGMATGTEKNTSGIGGDFTGYGGSGVRAYGTNKGVNADSQVIGVYARATGRYNSTDIHYGGYFEAESQSFGGSNLGRGIYAEAKGSEGRAVEGIAHTYSYGKTNYGGYFKANNLSGRGVYAEATGSQGRGVSGHAPGENGFGVYGGSQGAKGKGVVGWGTGASGRGVEGWGTAYDFYAAGPGTNYGPFTGGHEVRLAEDMPMEFIPGLIVSVTGRAEVRRDEQGDVSLSSTLPTATLSRTAMDKAVFGVLVREMPLDDEHWYTAEAGERFAVVNALGEGRVWVCDLNGPIEVGDYVTSSDVPGYGQRQSDDVLRSCTVGKAIETVDWETVEDTVEFNGRRAKAYLLAVVYTCG
ncbi:MAG: hypothetical protein EOM25_10470 [Deltaproteobacteria bacterium]|nr:hypothetical protein [Deltaproteobacteria bacterium]